MSNFIIIEQSKELKQTKKKPNSELSLDHV